MALRFARALVCSGDGDGDLPCGVCSECACSATPEEEPHIDGSGKAGPLYRHMGNHPGLFWVERGTQDTRIRIAQVRALQSALRLRGTPGARRVAVIADAEWLNQEAQNALLRLLEEPPAGCSLLLVTQTAAGLLATVRSRCQRLQIPFPSPHLDRTRTEPDALRWLDLFDRAAECKDAELLDCAESFRGSRAVAAVAAARFLETATLWLRERVVAAPSSPSSRVALDAFSAIQACRKALAQNNANPQMTVERALYALRSSGT